MEEPDSHETANTSSTSPLKKKFTVLRILVTVYGVLYLALIISFWFESNSFDHLGTENIVANLAFLVFLAGYYMVWKNEKIAGIIFIFWWAIMWALALFIAETDRGAGVGMGLPLFILAILLIISWHRDQRQTAAIE